MNARNLTPEVNMARRAHHAANRADRNAANRARWAEKKGQYKVASDKWREAHRDDLLSDYQRRGQEHRAFLDGLKAGKPCLDCVGVYPPFCMEFDHVRGTKRWALGKMANHRREAVLAELEKCELVCCACHRVRTQARKGASRIPKVRAFREWLSALKATPCKDCGKTLHHPAMDFDHLQDDKVSGISAMWSWSREKVLAEIAKCELVCANCHRVRTMSRKAVIPVMEPGV
jgi:hypothetical protein